jgi:hypothetical protein
LLIIPKLISYSLFVCLIVHSLMSSIFCSLAFHLLFHNLSQTDSGQNLTRCYWDFPSMKVNNNDDFMTEYTSKAKLNLFHFLILITYIFQHVIYNLVSISSRMGTCLTNLVCGSDLVILLKKVTQNSVSSGKLTSSRQRRLGPVMLGT